MWPRRVARRYLVVSTLSRPTSWRSALSGLPVSEFKLRCAKTDGVNGSKRNRSLLIKPTSNNNVTIYQHTSAINSRSSSCIHQSNLQNVKPVVTRPSQSKICTIYNSRLNKYHRNCNYYYWKEMVFGIALRYDNFWMKNRHHGPLLNLTAWELLLTQLMPVVLTIFRSLQVRKVF